MIKISKNTPLLKKLRFILANKKYHNAIRWSKEVIILIMNQGSEIEILNVKDIVNRILTRYFNTNQYRSFHKSLIDYGFKYIKYTYKGVFYHPSYRKDTSYLDDLIKSRTTIVFLLFSNIQKSWLRRGIIKGVDKTTGLIVSIKDNNNNNITENDKTIVKMEKFNKQILEWETVTII